MVATAGRGKIQAAGGRAKSGHDAGAVTAGKIDATGAAEGPGRREPMDGPRSKTWTMGRTLRKNFDTGGGGWGAGVGPRAEAFAFGIGAGNAAAEGDFGGKKAGEQIEELVKEIGRAVDGFLPEGLADVPQMRPENGGVTRLKTQICHKGNCS
jgi:hypothetical protein